MSLFLAWDILFAHSEQELNALETKYGITLKQIVDDYIEKACPSDSLKKYLGNKGTFVERLTALRDVISKKNPELSSFYIPDKYL
jgi:hypothetical protein